MFGRFIKFLIALALVPLVAGEIWTLIDFAKALAPAGPWRQGWVVAMGAGFAVWTLIFFLLPRTMWLYVLGHEFTHALAAMLAGGKVSAFKVTAQGGHVMTDRVNWWIALSPYFVPIYTLIWVALWLTVDVYYPLHAWLPVLFFGIGMSYAFHVTFTLSMLHPRQTDLSREGYIFSAVIILLFNVAIILVPMGVLTHQVLAAWHLFMQRTGESYVFAWHEVVRGIAWAQKLMSDQGR